MSQAPHQSLVIEELEIGSGETAATDHTVRVHYTGWLADAPSSIRARTGTIRSPARSARVR